MNMRFIKIILIAIATITLFSCGEKKTQFTVTGAINNADTLMLYLERRELAKNVVLDSVRLDSEGKFSFEQDATEYPEFYIIRLDNQTINFAIDSTETITINADKKTFATNYQIEGSYSSSRIKDALLMLVDLRSNIDKLKKAHANNTINDQVLLDSISQIIDQYREKASNMILDDYKSPAAYYLLLQRLDNMLILNPLDKKDLNLYRAVATVWDTYYPNSPRTAQLKEYTLQAISSLKAQESQEDLVNMLLQGGDAEDKDFFTITLPNVTGKEVSTKSLRGKTVILDFTAYGAEYSVAHNIRLNKVYEKHKSNLEIYQVSFDGDKHAWQNAATNLPWICVRDQQSLNSKLMSKFNITTLPTTYILNKEGQVIKKVALDENLEKEVAKIL